MTVDERKQRVLQAIVALYGLEGEPVGSGLLASHFDMAVSSATLRNEMAALTKLGLLEQPHTSAGRVPSAKGYRYYLDHLLQQHSQPLDAATAAQIRATFAALDQEPDQLAQGAAKALARMTGYTAAVTTPRADDLCIVHYEVVQVGRYSAAVLAVTNAGYARTRVARVQIGLTREKAAALAALLNSRLTFVAYMDLSRQLLAQTRAEAGADLAPVVNAAAALLEDCANPHVYLGGEQNLLSWPELANYQQRLLATLNDDEAAGRMITPATNATTVFLGEDFAPEMPGLCVISRRYLVGGGLSGTIALVGPARMPFPKLIPILEAFAGELGKGMTG
ncbi:MAG: heat-inducible transcription repressor HrcA [Faecalibacterium sp.]|nr:heat-inducible transcription repressor HrcA [Faecalibacterium sp.]